MADRSPPGWRLKGVWSYARAQYPRRRARAVRHGHGNRRDRRAGGARLAGGVLQQRNHRCDHGKNNPGRGRGQRNRGAPAAARHQICAHGQQTRKYILHHDDLALAWRAPIASVTFIPAASLDEQTVLRRFGAPAERIRVDERVEHFLYPDKGLDLALDSKGKEVLQYVAPRQFARLREPLIKVAPVTTQSP